MTSPYLYPGLITKADVIDQTAAAIWNISVEELNSKCRKEEFIYARHAVRYFRINNLADRPSIISREQKINHATIWHSCKTVEALLTTDKDFAGKYQEMINCLQSAQING